MKLKKGVFFEYLNLNKFHCLLSLTNTLTLNDYFCLLDIHEKKTLNDIQFYHFMKHVTTMGKKHIMLTFDMLDWDADGEIGFEEFYMMVCILLSSEHDVEETFICHHFLPVFELLDMDSSKTINLKEFKASGFLFNLKGSDFKKILNLFDITGDECLNLSEFQKFTMMCMDAQKELKRKRGKLHRLMDICTYFVKEEDELHLLD
uniref:EF-hand domain-containing protein n=1 Tax=Sinocyclocheilus grahami TaxID=75366 RepID=A0A672MP89_SINGR